MNTLTPTQRVQDWLEEFANALQASDTAAARALFAEDSYWRDLVAFTWNIKTMEGRAAIGDMLSATLATVQPCSWAIDGEANETEGVVDAWFTFETAFLHGRGHVRLNDQGCRTLLTTAQAVKGYEEKAGPAREAGVVHGPIKNRETWTESRAREVAELGYTKQPYVVIVGGGQGGIALGARLRRLDVPTIIIERDACAGDSWRKRYKSLCLHDPVWYDHMPYLPFPDHWPVFTPKDKIGDWLESYVKIMELNYWTKSTCKSARFDEASGEWTVVVDRDGESITLKPKQLVLATGMSGFANMPDVPGIDTFPGDVWHSSKHPGGENYKGKKAVVVGSNNSSHDICADLWENGADVTMVQRSPTLVVKSDTMMEVALGDLYSEKALENGIDHNQADLIFASIPYAILPEVLVPQCEEIKQRDADFYERLGRAGFMYDFGADDTGVFLKYLRRGSGYYIDVGASDLVASGDIKLKNGEIAALNDTGVVMSDGSVVPADLVVFATGYGSMNNWAAQLISQEVADKVGKCWGLGSNTTKDPGPWEGELRNMWKPTQQEALWFHGGNLHQSRHYSQFLSLQLKARHVGIPTPVYGLAEVHHKS